MATKSRVTDSETIVQVRKVLRKDHNLFKAWCSGQGFHMGDVLRKIITVLPKDPSMQTELKKFLVSHLEPEDPK